MRLQTADFWTAAIDLFANGKPPAAWLDFIEFTVLMVCRPLVIRSRYR